MASERLPLTFCALPQSHHHRLFSSLATTPYHPGYGIDGVGC